MRCWRPRTFEPLTTIAFRFSYPSNWEVAGDSVSTVTIRPRAGVVQGAVACGVILSGLQREREVSSLDDAT